MNGWNAKGLLAMNVTLETLTESLAEKQDLTVEQAGSAAELLASAEPTGDVKKAFLKALAVKGETGAEVAAFARTFRGLAVDPGVADLADRAIDVCGTGGDRSGSFNISTVVSFVVATARVPVFKHGNRSITSKCGSADFLVALGIDIQARPETIRKALDTVNYCFFFAPAYHPAFKEIMPVRKELAAEGVRTIFNILGPLINPGKPAHQLLGVFADAWVNPLADALGSLGLKRGLVVHSRLSETTGMDELSCAAVNRVAGFGELATMRGVWTPEQAGLQRCHLDDLRGGSTEENVAILEGIFAGRGNAGLVDTICYNAGAALWVAGRASDLKAGVEQARGLLLGGAVKDWLEHARAVFAV